MAKFTRRYRRTSRCWERHGKRPKSVKWRSGGTLACRMSRLVRLSRWHIRRCTCWLTSLRRGFGWCISIVRAWYAMRSWQPRFSYRQFGRAAWSTSLLGAITSHSTLLYGFLQKRWPLDTTTSITWARSSTKKPRQKKMTSRIHLTRETTSKLPIRLPRNSLELHRDLMPLTRCTQSSNNALSTSTTKRAA